MLLRATRYSLIVAFSDLTPCFLGMVRFLYYLNPTSLDRNLEFDCTRNLFKEPMGGIQGHGP